MLPRSYAGNLGRHEQLARPERRAASAVAARKYAVGKHRRTHRAVGRHIVPAVVYGHRRLCKTALGIQLQTVSSAPLTAHGLPVATYPVAVLRHLVRRLDAEGIFPHPSASISHPAVPAATTAEHEHELFARLRMILYTEFDCHDISFYRFASSSSIDRNRRQLSPGSWWSKTKPPTPSSAAASTLARRSSMNNVASGARP